MKTFTKILSHRIADNFSAKWFDSRNSRCDSVDTEPLYFCCYAHPQTQTVIVDFWVFCSASMLVMMLIMLVCRFVRSSAWLLCCPFSVMMFHWPKLYQLSTAMLIFYYSTKVIHSKIVVQCQFLIEFVVLPNHIRHVDDVMCLQQSILMDSWSRHLVVVDNLLPISGLNVRIQKDDTISTNKINTRRKSSEKKSNNEYILITKWKAGFHQKKIRRYTTDWQ